MSNNENESLNFAKNPENQTQSENPLNFSVRDNYEIIDSFDDTDVYDEVYRVNEKLCIEDLGYRVDSFIFDRTFEDNSDITHRGLFMMRYIQKERVKIFELVSVFTGNVIYYNFENIEKRQLQEELNIYGCGDELGIISTDSSSVCYTDFDACYFDLKSGVGSTAASDWVS